LPQSIYRVITPSNELIYRTGFKMAVPKRKVSPSRRGKRRGGHQSENPTYVENKDSGELHRPHHIDLKTGMYNGRKVIETKEPK